MSVLSSENQLLIPGPAGLLEAVTTLPQTAGLAITAVVCHPHPQMGGTMQNKVVTTLSRVFRELGLNTVRFNYRGVGKSSGSFAKGIGETEDLLAVLDWVKQERPQDTLWLAGFSFGAYISLRAANLRSIDCLVSVAPPVHYSDFFELSLPTCPWLLVQGEQDEVVDPKAVLDWATNLSHPPQIIRFPQAGHFFHGKLMDLRETLTKRLDTLLPQS